MLLPVGKRTRGERKPGRDLALAHALALGLARERNDVAPNHLLAFMPRFYRPSK